MVFGRTSSGVLDKANLGNTGFIIQGGGSGTKAYKVGAAGDVNGDGVADFIVGAPSVGTDAAYVVYGGASLAGASIQLSNVGGTVSGFKIQGPSSRNFGYDVSYAGDLNGDGLADLLVGSTARPAAPPYRPRTLLAAAAAL